MADGYEPVFTVKDFWDCPRSCVANYRGKPHFHECNFDEAKDDFSDVYRLTPLSADAFKLALEDWEIFNRWNEALQSGETDRSTCPCLPEHKSRYEELRRLLEPLLNTDVDQSRF
jgi:hypothetical protein